LEVFSRFAAQLDDETRRTLERGRRVREVLKQNESELLGVGDQIAVLLAATEGVFDAVPLETMPEAQRSVRAQVRERLPELDRRIGEGAAITEEDRAAVVREAFDAVRHWIPGE